MSADAERNEYGVIEVPPANVRNGSQSSTTDRFDQSRKEWPEELITAATERLCEHYAEYDVSPDDIYDVESYFNGEYEYEDALRLLHIIDYGGLDAKVDCSQKTVDVALRIRPSNPDYEVDLSLRTENGIPGKAAEYDKWLNGYDDGDGYWPGVIAFGVANEAEDAFESFHLLKTEPLLDAILNEELVGEENDTDGMAKARYFPIESLRDAGCVLESWGDGQ